VERRSARGDDDDPRGLQGHRPGYR
jgi:hypothetical protein